MGSIYEARWNNAVKQAKKINKYLTKNYVPMFWGEVVTHPIKITEEGIGLPLDGTGTVMIFIKDLDLDNGYYTPVKEMTQYFRDEFKFYKEVKVR
jgi:hypothetical protein